MYFGTNRTLFMAKSCTPACRHSLQLCCFFSIFAPSSSSAEDVRIECRAPGEQWKYDGDLTGEHSSLLVDCHSSPPPHSKTNIPIASFCVLVCGTFQQICRHLCSRPPLFLLCLTFLIDLSCLYPICLYRICLR